MNPDVYHGSPAPITALFAIVPKVAAFALIIRLLTGPFMPLHEQYIQILGFVALASMIVGALAGLAQSNIKRLLAYSSIANIGYALLGLLSADEGGVASVILYLSVYMIMTAGVFAVVLCLRRQGQYLEKIADFSGLSKKNPFLAYCMVGLLFSMSGLPPMAGFFAKFFVFQSLVGAGYITLAILGVLTSVVAAFYYLRIIKRVIMFNEPRIEFDRGYSWSRGIVMVGSFTLFFSLRLFQTI